MQRSKGGTQGRGVKMKPSQVTAKKPPNKRATQKPFAGSVFYLDIASRLVAEKLEKDIKALGGTVEGFLSKDISYLITTKKEAKCAKSLKYLQSVPSPGPTQNSGSSSARPNGRRGEAQNGSNSKKRAKEDASRGKSLLKKAIKEREILPKNSMLANAMQWGVHILHLDEAKTYIEQKKRSMQPDASTKPVKRPAQRKPKAQKLKEPFIKVEDDDRSSENKPVYLMAPFLRSFQTIAPKYYHLLAELPIVPPKWNEVRPSIRSFYEKRQRRIAQAKLPYVEPKKRGYCECCLLKYEDLEPHLLSMEHRTYAKGSHYKDVDNLIASFDFDFVDWSTFKPETHRAGLFIPTEIETPEEGESPPELLPANNLEPGAVQAAESSNPQDAASALAGNPICHPEPVLAVPFPHESLCSVTGVTDSSKPLSSQVTASTPMNVSPAQLVAPIDTSPGCPESPQNDLCLKESNTKRTIDLEPPETAQNDHSGLPEPCKRLKLGDSLCLETDSVCAAPPEGTAKPSGNLERSVPLEQSDASCHLPHSSPPRKLHRKVKQLARKAREPEELPCSSSSCKVSVPLEDCSVSLSKDRLDGLFHSSDSHTEFVGFSSNSLANPQGAEQMEEQPSSPGLVLWPLCSSTGSSASTFNGF